MTEPNRPGDRSAAQRLADHAGLARLSETLVPALVSKLNASGLGELEVREGEWRIRLRRPAGAVTAGRRAERPRLGVHAPGHGPVQGAGTITHGAPAGVPAAPAAVPSAPVVADSQPVRRAATSPAVGIYRAGAGPGTRVRAGDRIAIVDLLGIPQDVVAPIDGIVTEVLAQGGDAVEYGEEVAVVEAEPEEPAAGGDELTDREA
jgi:acetyl-CoA carboxylase biotin carboxyl carrier protein